MEASLVLLLQLVLAHLITDFVLQTKKMVVHKQTFKAKSWVLYVHSSIAGLATYVLLQDWSGWMIPVLIAVTHYGIDLWKLHQKQDNLRYFLIDQILHFVVLFFAWLFIIDGFSDLIPTLEFFLKSPAFLAVTLGYLMVIFPVGFLIGKATERWQKQMDDEMNENSLRQAGRYIGIFERILILTLILSSQFAAIGFLIGAKSILRFSETKGARKQTEYVLIGTLMSFSICIIIGMMIRFILTIA